LHRRRFLRGSAMLALGAAAVPNRGLAAGVAPEHMNEWMALFQDATPVSVADYTPVSLTDAEFATLAAAVDRLIPADDEGPGAADAGVQIYIDRSLKGPNAAVLPMYQAGIAALDVAAGADGFAGATADKQDEILTNAESGDVPDLPDGFFALLLEHTRQGMFCDPIYGGNVDFAGWDLIGYPGIKLVWTEEEQELDTIVKPEHVSVAKYGGKGW
jgi:hypothetical protein